MDIRFIPTGPRNTLADKLAAESLENRDYAKTPRQWNHQCNSDCWPHMLRYGASSQCDPFEARAAAGEDYATPDNWN